MNPHRVVAWFALSFALALSPPFTQEPWAAPVSSNTPEVIDLAVISAGGTGEWWSSTLQNIAQQEYETSVSADGLQAPNRAHNLRTYFHDDGIEVVRRDVPREETPWRFEWHTVGWGREDRIHPVSPAPPHPSGTRVEYRYVGGLTEWYVNRREGLEQGFQVSTRPEGKGDLVIAGMLSTELRAEPAANGQRIDFYDFAGAGQIRYTELHVFDATGRELPARLTMDGTVVRILTDDHGAVYPLEVDPYVMALGPEWEGDDPSARYGTSVSTAGDVNADGYSDVIVGAPYYDGGANGGRAFLYLGSTNGPSTEPDWTVDGETNLARLGESVSAAGDVDGDGYDDVIVGAPGAFDAVLFQGMAYLFRGVADGLEPDAAWTAEGDQSECNFGHSVSTAGDVDGDDYDDVIIGANLYDTVGGIDHGRAYIYLGSEAGLADAPVWTESNDAIQSWFGHSVSTAGDVNADGYDDVIVGAPYITLELPLEGRAYLYLGSDMGPAEAPAWTADGDQTNAGFGYSVSLAGDVNGNGCSDVIIGAPGYDGTEIDEGRACVYRGSNTGPPLPDIADWTAQSGQQGAEFGSSVSTAGDVNGDGYADVIIGAPEYDHGADQAQGQAYVYFGSADDGLNNGAAYVIEGTQVSARLGYSVSAAGDVNGSGFGDVLIGSPWWDGPEQDEGKTSVYYGTGELEMPLAAWIGEENQAEARYGVFVGEAGDVNGDGYGDVIVGASYYDNGEANEGRVFVYHGAADGLPAVADWTAEGDQPQAYFGHSVSTAGDVNNDGYSDVLIGAYGYDNGQMDEGRAYVYHGSSVVGLLATPDWTAEINQAGASFGHSVSNAGDVNGDGYGDIIIGAWEYTEGQAREGAAFLYLGSRDGVEENPVWTAQSDQEGARFGHSVSTGGDVNRDGYSDVIIGAYAFDNGQVDEGRAFVYFGSHNDPPLPPGPSWTAEGNQAQAYFGNSVADAGDVNGDGYGDIIIGASNYNNGEENEGRAYVYLGSAVGPSDMPNWTAECDHVGAKFGKSVSTAGDLDLNGCSDVIVGASQYEPGGGRAYVYLGWPEGIAGVGGLADDPVWIAMLGQADGRLGHCVSTAGDVNGDGYADIIVGAPWCDGDEVDEGLVFMHYGGGAEGAVPILARQRGTHGVGMDLLGRSNSSHSFRLKARGVSPVGRSDVRLEWNVAEISTALDMVPTQYGSWTDTGPPGPGSVGLDELVDDLIESTNYHWRLRIAGNSPFFPHSPWFTMARSVPSVKHLRTGPGGAEVDPADGAEDSVVHLDPVRPNPFYPTATMRFTVPEAGRVRLEIFSVSGRLVKVLANEHLKPGRHVRRWNGTNTAGDQVGSGVYFARFRWKDIDERRDLVMLK